MATETFYIMEDGTNGDPREIAADAKGVLRHKDGRAVDYAPHGPRSRSVDPDEERRKTKPKAKLDEDHAKAKSEAKDMKAEEPTRAYTTRDVKAG